LPMLFRELFPDDPECLAVAYHCEEEGTAAAARALGEVGRKKQIRLAKTATDSVAVGVEWKISSGSARMLANTAGLAAELSPEPDKYLLLSADLAYDVLRELGSPGVALVETTS
jgi:hypothetical protein